MELTLNLPLLYVERYKIGDRLNLRHYLVDDLGFILAQFEIFAIDIVACTVTIRYLEIISNHG